jgi:hypothetical protein
MAIRVSKTHNWTFDLNDHAIDSLTVPRDMIWREKNALVRVGGVVKRSSTRLAVGNGDLWVAATDLNTPSGGHFSWAVITMPNGMEIYITFDSNHSVTRHISPGGLYTGGTTNTKPTATDEIAFNLIQQWITNTTTGSVLNTMLCDNGTIRMVQLISNAVVRVMHIEYLENPSAHLQGGIIYRWSTRSLWADLQRADSFRAFISGVQRIVRITTEGVSGWGLGEIWVSPDLDGDYPCVECNSLCMTAGAMQRLGKLPDFYLGTISGVNTGDTYSSSTTAKEYAHFDHALYPWDNLTVPRIS